MAAKTGDESELGQGDTDWLSLLLDVTLIANEAESVDRAVTYAMARVCEHNRWDCAFSQIRGRFRDLSWPVRAVTSMPGIDAAAQELARAWFSQVIAAGRTQVIEDLAAADHDFELPCPPPSSGGAIAVPLLVGGRAVGAMVFFSHRALSDGRDNQQIQSLLQIMESIGTQMGRVVERWQVVRRITEEMEAEREALGREIHDGLAQQLVGVNLLVQNLRRQMSSAEEPYSEQWDLLVENLREAQAQVRALARGLSATAILSTSESLVDQLQELVEVVETGHGVTCRLEVDEAFAVRDELTRSQLLRIAREAVFNALRHAGPSEIEISLLVDGGQMRLEVRDDGSGLPTDLNAEKGMGLSSIRHRAELVGAWVEFESERGRGTVLRCVL